MTITPKNLPILIILSVGIFLFILTCFWYIQTHQEWIAYKKGYQALENKQWEQASESFQKSIHLGLKDPHAYLQLAEAYTKLEKYKEAIPYLELYLQERPKDKGVLKFYADLLTADQQYGKAEEIYKKLIESKVEQ